MLARKQVLLCEKFWSFGNLIFLHIKMNHPLLNWGNRWLGHNPIHQPTDTGNTEAQSILLEYQIKYSLILVTSLIQEKHPDYQESKYDIASYELGYRAVSVSLADGKKMGGMGSNATFLFSLSHQLKSFCHRWGFLKSSYHKLVWMCPAANFSFIWFGGTKPKKVSFKRLYFCAKFWWVSIFH